MPTVLLSVLKEENVYIALDSKEITAFTLINRIWMFKLCWPQETGYDLWASTDVWETSIHSEILQLVYTVKEITDPAQQRTYNI